MKVTITDKDALGALSWEALRTYLDSSDWQYTEDIPGKAAVYQHTDDTGRVWEILAPLRRNLADYVSRMGDAVTILARIEDRSELDVYEDLRVLGAQPTQVDDATRAVHDQIRRWLAEESWTADDVPDPLSSFNIMVTLNTQRRVNIFQRKEHVDHITIALHVIFSNTEPTAQPSISLDMQRRILRDIERDALIMGLDFQKRGISPIQTQFSSFIYFDGLSKDRLVERIRLVLQAVSLSVLTIAGSIEAPGIDPEISEEVIGRVDHPDNVRIFPVPQAATG